MPSPTLNHGGLRRLCHASREASPRVDDGRAQNGIFWLLGSGAVA